MKPSPESSRKIVMERMLPRRSITPSGCWTIPLAGNERGYVTIRVRPHRYLIHILSYVAYIGQIPDGLFVLHACDNPPCWNPDHLFVGTQADNIHDMDKKGRRGIWHPAGERNPSVKITKEVAAEIKSAQGMQKEIAKQYGVSKSLVSAIKCGVAWDKPVQRKRITNTPIGSKLQIEPTGSTP